MKMFAAPCTVLYCETTLRALHGSQANVLVKGGDYVELCGLVVRSFHSQSLADLAFGALTIVELPP